MGIDQVPKLGTMVVMLQVSHFVDQHIVDAGTRGFYQMRVQDDFTCWRTTPPHLLAENLDDDDPALAKKLKTETSHRTIPIHADLIDMGLLAYAETIRKKGHTHLFPNLPHKRGRDRGGYVSRTFMEGFRGYGELNPDTGLGTQALRTHSLRHTYRKAGFRVPDQDFVKIVMGHYVEGDSVQTYGWEIYNMPDVLFERVTKLVQLPPLDMPYLKGLADRFLCSLRTSS